ncbi:hypothetical protein EDB29_1011133 [Vibrio crassostreae]|nr:MULTISPECIES: hypothetical protein [Vibrio]CAH6850342.1 hypothetical protein VCHA34P121_10463 [Vibrio chagasii]TCT44321.1 hypothetical protein EDB29_1011133 [Vibrio crassostreae]CAH6861735.1 hypothetical protein VCHA28FP16_10802 [Vibrio chagasii]CAH6925474.1 hypothetical protein VCHA48P437_100118 [Vibrio chagasii]CAH6944407.1 hypothetical protein VCHA44O286_110118 [Vibrio chagasii]
MKNEMTIDEKITEMNSAIKVMTELAQSERVINEINKVAELLARELLSS